MTGVTGRVAQINQVGEQVGDQVGASTWTQIRVLWRKELRQLPRKRGAMLSTVLFPFLFFVILPVSQMLPPPPVRATAALSRVPQGAWVPPAMALAPRDPAGAFRVLTLPLVVLIGGIVVPNVMAIHSVIIERERRTLDLLVALPVSLTSIIWAKLLATLTVAGVTILPLFAVNCLVALRLRMMDPGDAAAILALLAAAVTYSTTASVVVSIIAGDFRTANNVSGTMMGPLLMLSLALLITLPPRVAPLVVAALLLTLSALAAVAARRWLSVERLLR